MKVNNGHRPSEKEHIRISTLWCKCAHRPKISPCPLKYHCSARWPHIRVAFRGGNGDIYIYLFMFFFHLKLLAIIYFWTALIRTIFSKGQKRSLWNDIFFCWSKRGVVCPISHRESAEHARLKCSYTGCITFILDTAVASISKHIFWIFHWITSRF